MSAQTLALPERHAARIRFAVGQLRGLTPGLAQLPLGLALLSLLSLPGLMSLVRPTRVPDETVFLVPLLVLVVALVGQQAIKRWYARHYGKVLRSAESPSYKADRNLALLFLLLSVSLFVLEGAWRLSLPVHPGIACLALLFGVHWLRYDRAAIHQGVLAALLLAAALLLRAVPALARHPGTSLTALLGLTILAQALCDHHLLVHTLHPLPEETDENSVP